jgi:hypothetical protein
VRRTPPGARSQAPPSWRTNQWTRVVDRPSLGASSSTWKVTLEARRSAVTTRFPTASGMRMAPLRCPSSYSIAVRAGTLGSDRLLTRHDGEDLGTELEANVKAGEAEERIG